MKLKYHDRQQYGHSRRNTAIGFVIGMLLGGLVDLYTGDLGIATVIGMILGSLFGYRGFEQINLMEFPPGVVRRLVISGTLLLIILMGSLYMLSHEIGTSISLILVIAPSIAGMIFLFSLGNAISRLDELQRRIQTEAIAIGFGLTALITMTYGLLGLTGAPQPNWMFATVIMTFSWLVGKIWIRWKYR